MVDKFKSGIWDAFKKKQTKSNKPSDREVIDRFMKVEIKIFTKISESLEPFIIFTNVANLHV